MTRWRLGDLDVFFLSYDETAADRHFEQLQSVSPRPPRRVHGVKGLQNAYSCAARASRTERFLTVDADSFVADDTVFRVTAEDDGIDNLVFAFMALNPVNGLVYGNGSVKCWPKPAFEGLRTHEHTPPGGGHVDFYHALPYRWLPQTASINRFATDPFHAFRGGYREAVKLSLRPDSAPGPERRPLVLSERARHRISTWISVGMDADHGEWAIYGARRGLVDYWLDQSLQVDALSDFDYFVGLWRDIEKQGRPCADLIAATSAGMIRLGLPDACLTPEESIAVKAASHEARLAEGAETGSGEGGFSSGGDGEAPACLHVIDSTGEPSPLLSASDWRGGDAVLASLSEEVRPLLGRALREHRMAGGGDALTLLVAPRPAPKAGRSDDPVTAFLASGAWVRSLIEGTPAAATELCYRALAAALGGDASIALSIVDREGVTDPIAGEPRDPIDVIMPHRGHDQHLRVALASLAGQTCRSRIILCFDQPAAPELVRELTKQDNLDLYEITPNPAGPYVPRQHFALASNAPFVAFQDSDDFSLASRLAMLAAFAEAQDADIAGCHELRLDEIKRTVEAIRYPLDVNRALNMGVGSVQLFSTAIMRTRTVRRLGGFSTNRTFAADRHFQLRAHWSARILNLDAFLYVRRRRADSLSTAESTGMAAPDRQRINLLWDQAFQDLREVQSAAQERQSTAVKSAFRIEHAHEEFMIRNLRTEALFPAQLRAHGN